MSDVTLSFDNVKATIQAGVLEIAEAKKFLSYRQPGYRFTSLYKRRLWDGWVCLLKYDKFPAGLVFDVAKHLRTEGHNVIISDERGDPPEPDARILDITNDIKLDDHQQGAINSIRRHSRGVVAQDVSAGKSVIIAEAVRQLGVGALVVVGRKELLKQQYDQFINLAGFPPKLVGRIGDGVWQPSLVTVATVQTLRARLSKLETASKTREWMAGIPSWHVDECHHLPAASYELIGNALTSAYYRAGYSATAHKSLTNKDEAKATKLAVTGLVGPVISSLSAVDNIETGRAVGAEIFFVDTPGADPVDWDGMVDFYDSAGIKRQRKQYSYPLAVRTGIIENEPRNQMIARLATRLAKHGAVVVLTNRIEHGKALRAIMQEQGLEEVA